MEDGRTCIFQKEKKNKKERVGFQRNPKSIDSLFFFSVNPGGSDGGEDGEDGCQDGDGCQGGGAIDEDKARLVVVDAGVGQILGKVEGVAEGLARSQILTVESVLGELAGDCVDHWGRAVVRVGPHHCVTRQNVESFGLLGP